MARSQRSAASICPARSARFSASAATTENDLHIPFPRADMHRETAAQRTGRKVYCYMRPPLHGLLAMKGDLLLDFCIWFSLCF